MIVGSLLLVLGAISMFTSIPGGVVLLALGTAMLICSSTRFAHWIQKRRSNNPWLDRGMHWLEERTGTRVSGALSRTRPSEDTSVAEPPTKDES